jgi:hypothetical protein
LVFVSNFNRCKLKNPENGIVLFLIGKNASGLPVISEAASCFISAAQHSKRKYENVRSRHN